MGFINISHLLFFATAFTKENNDTVTNGNNGTIAQIEYSDITIEQLLDDLKSNAMRAQNTYKGNYYCFSGYLTNIDASGKYININQTDKLYAFDSIQANINDTSVRDIIMELNVGDQIKISGRCKDVGEVLGYTFDIDKIEKIE